MRDARSITALRASVGMRLEMFPSMRSSILFALGLSLLTPACFVSVEDDPGPIVVERQRGDLSVFWTFDGFTGCGSVRDVRVIVYDFDNVLYDDAVYSCAFEGASYEQVLEGEWEVELYGLDAGGFSIYESGRRDVSVIGNADNQFTIDLGVVN
jgi:hypothetical protein